jgi:hypothetical protein
MHRSGAHCFVRAMKRGNARGAKGAGHLRRVGVNGQPDELLVLAEADRLPWGGTSRMKRELHVRICERLGVKFPGPTRQFPGPTLPGHGMALCRMFNRAFHTQTPPGSPQNGIQHHLHKVEHDRKRLPGQGL